MKMMLKKLKSSLSLLLGIAVAAAALWFALWIVRKVWGQFVDLDPSLAAGILTAATTILVATLTVVFGRYMERKREIEAHFRERKIEIYDAFLKELFKVFQSEEPKDPEDKLVPFLREWQRTMVLWGGPGVLSAYIKWIGKLKSGEPDAQSLLLTDAFFRQMRRDIGQSNVGLERGAFIHLLLRHPELLLELARTNPNISLAEVAEAEKALSGEDKS